MSARELITDLDGLTDEAISATKEGYKNVVVTIGVLGSSIVIFNPPSAAAAIEQYTKVYDAGPDENDTVFIIGFDDVLRTYQLTAI